MRKLVAPLDQIQLSQYREPAWRIEIFDTRSSVNDTINRVVRNQPLEQITGPRDFTSDVVEFNHTSVASDFAQTGVAVPSLTLMFADPGDDRFDPVRNPGGLGRFLRRGNTVRIYQGDSRVDPADWPATFTGRFVGQLGVDKNRTTGENGVAIVSIQGLGREADFINTPLTSEAFGAGTTLNFIATQIALTDMGLDSSEVEFSNWGGQVNGHLSLQFHELASLVAIANLMMPDGVMPRFNGLGILTQSLGLTTQLPSRIYSNRRLVQNLVRPFSNDQPYNCIKVLGLANVQSEIVQELQDLIVALHVTVGFFANDQEIDTFWTEDKTQLAKNIVFQVIQSANGGLSILGGGEEFVTIAAPIGTGTVGATISISTGYAPYLLIFFGLVYVVLSAIPDVVIAVGGGVTIPIGRIIQALALAIVLILMTKIGKGEYAFKGEPFEFVYKELAGTAELPGLTSQTRKKLTLMNQVLQTQSDVNNVARIILDRQQALGSPRTTSFLPDLALEPDDVYRLPGTSGNEDYQIQSIAYTGKRSEAGGLEILQQMNVSELTAVGLE